LTTALCYSARPNGYDPNSCAFEVSCYELFPEGEEPQTEWVHMAAGDLAEPLGFDGIWLPEHCGTPYGMTPNPIQALSYFAGRTERVSLGTFVVVAPWWHPVRLAHQIAYLDILSNGSIHHNRDRTRRVQRRVCRRRGSARGESGPHPG
jgi:Luciferase-like monooxygenase